MFNNLIEKKHDYKSGCLLGHPNFKENHNLMEINLHKQQAPDRPRRKCINVFSVLKKRNYFGLLTTRNCKNIVFYEFAFV